MKILLAPVSTILATKADERTDRARQCGQSAHCQECAGQDFEHDGAVNAGINESPKEPLPWDATADQRPVVACIDVMAVPVENPPK